MSGIIQLAQSGNLPSIVTIGVSGIQGPPGPAGASGAELRSGSALLSIGANTVNFSSSMSTSNYQLDIIDVWGIGVQQTGKTSSGFTCTTLSAGTINYIAVVTT